MSGRFLFRASLAALAVTLAVAGTEASFVAAQQASPSPLLSATPFLAAFGTLFAALGVILPSRMIDRWLAKLDANRSTKSTAACAAGSSKVVAAIAIIAAVIFVASVAARLASPPDPRLDDQQAFIELAQDI